MLSLITENKAGFYEAFKSKDPRFDGQFFVGVLSTGIYCRPVCKARLPKLENCNFYKTAAEAEKVGFRPCLQCRPEIAPGFAPIDSTASIARRAAKMIEENCDGEISIAQIAEKLGCTDRHLRRAFMKEYNVSPVWYRQSCRLLLAKNLLTDTNLFVLDVAMASGFGSLRRFNDLFKKQYGLSPSHFRKEIKNDVCGKEDFSILIGYRPPYRWEEILSFLEPRSIPGVEAIKNNKYFRTVHIKSNNKIDYYGTIQVENKPEKNGVSVTISYSLLLVLPQIISKVKNLFDLYCEPSAVYETLSGMNETHPDICKLGTRLPGCFDVFEMSVRAVLGQQITIKAATTLAGRFAESFGKPIETDIEGLDFVFPSTEDIILLGNPIENYLGSIGIIASRAKTILSLANVIESNEIEIENSLDPEKSIKELIKLPGIGIWTAEYIAMRAMGFTDAFPYTDLGIKKALAPRTQKEILKLSESWRPWRAYATINLWNSH